jgi:antitoxin component YwqK of YwqJK toxin-antitoxin module
MYDHLCSGQVGRRAAAFMEWLKHFVIFRDGKGILVNDLKQGTRYIKYPNGSLQRKWNYYNNQLDGLQNHWHENGCLLYEDNYSRGRWHGTQYSWYPNGQLSYKL